MRWTSTMTSFPPTPGRSSIRALVDHLAHLIGVADRVELDNASRRRPPSRPRSRPKAGAGRGGARRACVKVSRLTGPTSRPGAGARAPRVAAVDADLDVSEECWEEGHRVLLSGLGESRDALAGTRAGAPPPPEIARWSARTSHVLTETPSAAAAPSSAALSDSGRRSVMRACSSSAAGGAGSAAAAASST